MLESVLLKAIKSRNLFALSSVRHGGGGGRPHGRPTLNFKEKRILGLDKPYKQLKIRPTGFFEDIEEHFNPDRDIKINFADLKNFKEPDIDYNKNDKKTIQMSSLFGSSKSCGMVGQKPKRQPFSHTRIFGHRHQAKVSE